MEASFFSNHLANENAGTTKMLPPSGGEGHSSNENAAFPDITNTTCNRSNQNAWLPDTQRSTNQHPEFPDTTKPCVTEVQHNADKHSLFFL